MVSRSNIRGSASPSSSPSSHHVSSPGDRRNLPSSSQERSHRHDVRDILEAVLAIMPFYILSLCSLTLVSIFAGAPVSKVEKPLGTLPTVPPTKPAAGHPQIHVRPMGRWHGPMTPPLQVGTRHDHPVPGRIRRASGPCAQGFGHWVGTSASRMTSPDNGLGSASRGIT